MQPQRIAARRQQELCVMAMQELEWHSIDDVDVEGNELASVEDIQP